MAEHFDPPVHLPRRVRVRLDTRKLDAVVLRVDGRGHLHAAIHVRDAVAELAGATDGTLAGADAALDLNGVPRPMADMFIREGDTIQVLARRETAGAAELFDRLTAALDSTMPWPPPGTDNLL